MSLTRIWMLIWYLLVSPTNQLETVLLMISFVAIPSKYLHEFPVAKGQDPKSTSGAKLASEYDRPAGLEC